MGQMLKNYGSNLQMFVGNVRKLYTKINLFEHSYITAVGLIKLALGLKTKQSKTADSGNILRQLLFEVPYQKFDKDFEEVYLSRP